MGRTPSAGIFLPTDKTATCNISKRGGLAVAEGNVNMLTTARLRPGEKRSHNAIARVKPRGQVRDCNTDFHRWPISVTGDMHQTELRFDHDIVSSSLRIRTRLAIPRYRRVNQTRINLMQRLEVHSILL